MIISVIGCGYLGAVHAVSMAHLGHHVRAYDIDSSKVAALSSGEPPFYEFGLGALLRETLASGRLLFTHSPEEAIRGAEVHFICVGTPQQFNSDAADLSYVQSAFASIVEFADRAGTIVGKSTVPVGTAANLAKQLPLREPAQRLEVAWCPEFLREGTAIEDSLNPDRLVFGVTTNNSKEALLEVFRPLIEAGVPYITTDMQTAEMAKSAANSFLATKISFINAMSEICDAAGADIVTLSRTLGYDARIGSQFLDAGLGFGGGCLPKDLRSLRVRAAELGASTAQSLLHTVDLINLHQRERTVEAAERILGDRLSTKRIAFLGSAFKPNSDDVRDSPALEVAAALDNKGAMIQIHDPQAIQNSRKVLPALRYMATVEDACKGVDLVIHATSWSEYKEIDPQKLISVVRQPLLLDARNSLDLDFWSEQGWQVFGLGQGHLRKP